MENAQKAELIIAALQQRIGEMAATHELEKAILRAELTEYAQREEAKEVAKKEYSESLEKKTSK